MVGGKDTLFFIFIQDTIIETKVVLIYKKVAFRRYIDKTFSARKLYAK